MSGRDRPERRTRPRRYRPVKTIMGWALAGECMICEADHWGECGHWEVLPYRWCRRVDAEGQARIWQARQQLLLDVSYTRRMPVAAA